MVSDYRWSQGIPIAHRSKACSSELPEANASFTFLHEPEDDLKCVICLSVAEDPLQHEECGKLFCNECIEKHGKDKPCPHCKTEGQFYKDKKVSLLCSHRSSTHLESEGLAKHFGLVRVEATIYISWLQPSLIQNAFALLGGQYSV